MSTSAVSLIETDSPRPINGRPRGRSSNIAHCNNPHIDFKEVRITIRQYQGKGAFIQRDIDKAIQLSYKIPHSPFFKSYHESLGHKHRTRFGVERDIAIIIILISTMNLAEDKFGDWFKCAVNSEKLNELSGFDSLSRVSRGTSLLKGAGLIRIEYHDSERNKNLKYSKIFIHRDLLKLAGLTNEQIDYQIKLKAKNHKKRLNDASTKEHNRFAINAEKAKRELKNHQSTLWGFTTGTNRRRLKALDTFQYYLDKHSTQSAVQCLLLMYNDDPELTRILSPP